MSVGSNLGVRLSVSAWLEGRATAGWRAIRSAIKEEAEKAPVLVWLALALILGAAIWFLLPIAPPIVILLAPFILMVVSLRWLLSRWTSTILILSAGLLAGMIAADLESRRMGTVILDSLVTTQILGRVIARDTDHQGRSRYTIDRIKTDEPVIRRPPTRVRLVAAARHDPIEVGQMIQGPARQRRS